MGERGRNVPHTIPIGGAGCSCRFGAVRKSLSYERSLSKWERGANEGTSGRPSRPAVADDANMRDSPSLLRKKRGKINVGTATSEEREELPLALAPLVTDEAGRAQGRLHHSASWRVPMPMIKKSACRGRRTKMTSFGGESNTARNIPHSMKTFAGRIPLSLPSFQSPLCAC